MCAWARVSAAPRHSWLGCWGVWVFVCAPLPYPATAGWGVGVCLCLCARSSCTPPLLAGLCGVGVCAWAQVLAAPPHSRLECLGVCVSLRGPLLPRHSWRGCAAWVCDWSGVRAVPRHSWLGCSSVCVSLCALLLYPATPGLGGRCGCVSLEWGFSCALPLLAGELGCVCVCVRAPLVPRHSLLGCAVWVCVLELGFWLPPATPGWVVGVCVFLCAFSACTPSFFARACGVGVCASARVWAAPRHSWLGCWGVYVCLCARSACTPPLLAWVGGVGVCALARVLAAPRHFQLGCWGVCVGVRARPIPRHSWLGFLVWGLEVAWHLFLCCGLLRVVRAAGVCGTRGHCCLALVGVTWLWPACVSLACLVALCWCAAPHPVRLLSVLRSAFPTPWCLSPPRGLASWIYWAAAPGTWRLGENRALCGCRWLLPLRRIP